MPTSSTSHSYWYTNHPLLSPDSEVYSVELADEPGAKALFSSLIHLSLESLLHSPREGLDVLALGHRSNDKLINSIQSVYAHLIGNPP